MCSILWELYLLVRSTVLRVTKYYKWHTSSTIPESAESENAIWRYGIYALESAAYERSKLGKATFGNAVPGSAALWSDALEGAALRSVTLRVALGSAPLGGTTFGSIVFFQVLGSFLSNPSFSTSIELSFLEKFSISALISILVELEQIFCRIDNKKHNFSLNTQIPVPKKPGARKWSMCDACNLNSVFWRVI